MKWNLVKPATRVYEQNWNPDIKVKSSHKKAAALEGLGGRAELEITQGYFLPALFAAQ